MRDRLERLLLMYVRLMLANVPDSDRTRTATGAAVNSSGEGSFHRACVCLPPHCIVFNRCTLVNRFVSASQVVLPWSVCLLDRFVQVVCR